MRKLPRVAIVIASSGRWQAQLGTRAARFAPDLGLASSGDGP